MISHELTNVQIVLEIHHTFARSEDRVCHRDCDETSDGHEEEREELSLLRVSTAAN